MSDERQLPRSLVAQKAESIFSQKRHRFAALLEGSGQPDRVQVKSLEVDIVPTRCELDLRRRMAEREGYGGAALYLVDWPVAGHLARDIRARVAQGQVYRIGREERLRQVLHAARFGPDLTSSPLAALAVRGEIDEFPPSPKLTLDLPFACFTWLEAVVGEPFSRTNPREADFVRACRRAERGSLTQRAAGSADWRSWLGMTATILERHLSPLSGLVWRAWLAGQITALPAVLWVLEAFEAARADERDRKLLRVVLQHRYPSWSAAAENLPITADGATVTAWDAILRDDADGRAPAGLEGLVEQLDSTQIFRASCRMAEGLHAREEALAGAIRQLLAALDRSDADDRTWQGLQAACDGLRSHRAVGRHRRDSLDMLQRLAAWLWQNRRQPPLPAGAPSNVAIELAARFTADGGFVDWARRISGRERPAGVLGSAWEALRGIVESRRDAEERQFAVGMKAWAEAGRPPTGCIPIEQASRELVAGFLRGTPTDAPERRLLVLLMDGMSWARCRELCASLRDDGWEPLRWRPRGAPQGLVPPVLAAFPTITSVSRAAFFAGRLTAPGDGSHTSTDPARWRDNPAVRDFAGARGQLELFLKDRVEADRGQASQQVLEAIADADQPLVAAVINTIDDALKGTASLEFSTGAIEIKPLREMLLRARQARRAVLLIADHGHVLGERFERLETTKEAGGARWRVAEDALPLREHELTLTAGAWSPDPHRPVVLLTGERAQYSVHAHHGEHGGLSMAEVVAPAVLLGTPDLADLHGDGAADPELEIAPPDEPRWWREMAPAVAPRAEPEERPRPKQPATLFGDLGPIGAATPPPRPSRAVLVPAWVDALRDSATFKAALQFAARGPKERPRLEQQTLTVCRVLVEEGGRASAAAIAQAADVARGRVGGVIARVSSVLNAESETCVSFDQATETVVLDLERFRALFGVNQEKA